MEVLIVHIPGIPPDEPGDMFKQGDQVRLPGQVCAMTGKETGNACLVRYSLIVCLALAAENIECQEIQAQVFRLDGTDFVVNTAIGDEQIPRGKRNQFRTVLEFTFSGNDNTGFEVRMPVETVPFDRFEGNIAGLAVNDLVFCRFLHHGLGNA